MNRLISEGDLRAQDLPWGGRYRPPPGAILTPAARDYLSERRIEMEAAREAEAGINGSGAMTRVPIPDKGGRTYIDAATGAGMRDKPEDMTHLRGNLLVSKTHPAIRFRGGVDSLVAELLLCRLLAHREGYPALGDDLGQILERTRQVLAAEVREIPLDSGPLLGYSQDGLRAASHNVREAFGMDHPIPGWEMGELALALNRLRAAVRGVELLALDALGDGRPDIIRELNRLSSGVYILFCRVLSGWYGEAKL